MSRFSIFSITTLFLAVAAAVVIASSAYTLDESEQAIVVQLGAPVGQPVTEPGLHFKLPFVQEVRRFDKRLISWDGDPNQIPTRGEQFSGAARKAKRRLHSHGRLQLLSLAEPAVGSLGPGPRLRAHVY